jgi:hypothetical protein
MPKVGATQTTDPKRTTPAPPPNANPKTPSPEVSALQEQAQGLIAAVVQQRNRALDDLATTQAPSTSLTKQNRDLTERVTLLTAELMDKDQSVSSQDVLDVLQQEKIEIANSLTLSRARNQELFKEVVRLTEKLKESGVEQTDNFVSIDNTSE